MSTQFTYVTQHFILHNVQRFLEECCFDFAIKCTPGFLVMTGWNVPEAGEITEWSKRFPDYARDQRIGSIAWNNSITKALRDVCQLRHIAVHRRPINSAQLKELLTSSIGLCELLRDVKKAVHLRGVLGHFVDFMQTVEEHIQAAEDLLDKDVYNMQKQIDELNRQVWELTKKSETAINNARKNSADVISFAEKRMNDQVFGLFERIKDEEKSVKGEKNVKGEENDVKQGKMDENKSWLGIARQSPRQGLIISRNIEIIDLTGDDDHIILLRRRDLGYRTIEDHLPPPSQSTVLPFNGQQSQSHKKVSFTTGTKRGASESNETSEGSKKQKLVPPTLESQYSIPMELNYEEMGNATVAASGAEGNRAER
jgi:flagellar biosynthesis chaperone FliJ